MLNIANLKGTSLISKASEILTEYIVKKVRAGEYLPPEHELCKKLGIGRSTLREAVTVLESKGLVKRFHGQGVQVVDESQRAVSDMFQLLMKREGSTIKELIEARNIFEVKSAELAAERATHEDLQLIKKALQTMQSENVSLTEYVQADIDFHLAIAKASHNNVLLLILMAVRPLLHDAILATVQSIPRPEHVLKYHEKIFSAIEKQDVKGASKAMIEHLRGTESMIDGHKVKSLN
jgi:GntR family transcriptional regulator, transcriptional repressor for pyruvate dehydrogenase complex